MFKHHFLSYAVVSIIKISFNSFVQSMDAFGWCVVWYIVDECQSGMAMYANWSSVRTAIQTEAGHKSVLSLFPSTVGREVASAVVHSLAQSVARSNDNKEPSSLTTDADVRWTMQVTARCY